MVLPLSKLLFVVTLAVRALCKAKVSTADTSEREALLMCHPRLKWPYSRLYDACH